jgi:large subunit ribosomal protein L29
MTIKEIREKEVDHLRHELEERQKHMFDLRSQAVTEKLEDPSQLRKTRKDIARIRTVLRQRELEAAGEFRPAQRKKEREERKSKKGQAKQQKSAAAQ